ncbi:prepilin peptidase [Micromonospora sp. NPDC005324]|uniref:prepilin peptidase n=1 Tax=Micromonospora sp. NPDC005324 TaxID=3157033 RepID=UPI0033B86AA5
MNSLATAGLGISGAIVGVPLAAVAYGVQASGPVRIPERWWLGGAARPRVVIATAVCTGVAAAIVGAVMPPTVGLVSYAIFAVLGVGLAIIDVRCRRLPHCLTGALWTSSGLYFAVAALSNGEIGPLGRATAAGIVTVTGMLVIALSLPGQLGLGDVAFAGAITFNLGWLSWSAAGLGLFTGLILHGVFATTLKHWSAGYALTPMGPSLMVGWLLTVALGWHAFVLTV